MTPVRVELKPTGSSGAKTGRQTASNFKALWPTDPIFTALKDLNFQKSIIRNKRLTAFWGSFLLFQSYHIYKGFTLYFIRAWYSFGTTVHSLCLRHLALLCSTKLMSVVLRLNIHVLVFDWESTKPLLHSKLSLFMSSLQMLKVLPQLSPLVSYLPCLRSLK